MRDIANSIAQDYLIPDWPVPAKVKSLFTYRMGGVSTSPYNSLNLGDHVGDEATSVASNRQILRNHFASLSRQPPEPVFLQQVHGCEVAVLGKALTKEIKPTVADVAIANQSGLVCVIMVADCLPVLLTHSEVDVVVAAHAGWRGLAGQSGVGVIEHAYSALMTEVRRNAGWEPATDEEIAKGTLAWLGPCIGPGAFEVGEDVLQAFGSETMPADVLRCFKPVPNTARKWLADLPKLARLRLRNLSASQIYGNESSLTWCTFSNSEQYFSHRRDASTLGASGRMAACIWLDRDV